MTHTNPVLTDCEDVPITIGAMVMFRDSLGRYGRVKNVYPYAAPPSVAVAWFDAEATEHTNPKRITVITDGPTAESAAEAMRQVCGWLTPCAEPTRVETHERLGTVSVCTVCTRVVGTA